MTNKENMTLDGFTKYIERVKSINDYKKSINNELTQSEFQAILSAWARIEDYEVTKPRALAFANLKYRVPKSKIAKALKELPIKYTAFEKQKDRFKELHKESKIADYAYQLKMEEDEQIENDVADIKTKKPTYKYPVVLDKSMFKQTTDRLNKKYTIAMFDKSIVRNRFYNIFYGVAVSATYKEALEIARVTKLKFSDFIKEISSDGKNSEDESLLRNGLVHELTYDELFPEDTQVTLVKQQNQSEETQPMPIDVEQIQMWIDIKESLVVGSLGIYEKRKLGELISIKINELQGNL